MNTCFCRIKLKVPHEVAGSIAALRAAMEGLVVEVTKDPEYIRQLDPTNERLLNLIRQISKPSATGLNLMANNQRLVSNSCLIFTSGRTHDQSSQLTEKGKI